MIERLARLWPASALACWGLGLLIARGAGWEAGCLLCAGLALLHRAPWRRAVVALGLPLALLATGLSLPPWAWLLLLAALLALYPWRLWRDAPLFLTPPGAFDALPERLALPAGARLLDAGCGSGAGLRAWHAAYPHLELHGVEASWPLVLWARLRCPFARVWRGDLWAQDWSGYDLVYLFQRPESMPPAAEKALREMRPGSWLVSLDFAWPGREPAHRLRVGRHEVLVYGLN